MVVPTHRYQYRVDSKDRLIEVDSAWLAYARENGAANLTRDVLLGRSLWEFVEGELLIAIYSSIHTRVREKRTPAVFPFRCDSPTMRRYMRMTIYYDRRGELVYDSLVERAVPQRQLALLESDRGRTEAVIDVCSCCKRALLESIGWLDLEDVAFRTGMLEAQAVPQLRHTLCPKCADVMRNCVGNSDVA